MADKYVRLDLTTGRLVQQEAATTGGSGQGGKIVALGVDGLIPGTMLGTVGAPTLEIVADTNLAAGDYVNLLYTSAQRRARKANAVDATTPAHGYVLETITAASTGLMYTDGLNSQYPRGTFTTADIGKRVFLSTTGGLITLTPPSTVGNLLQVLGTIVAVDTTANLLTIDTEVSDGYVV